MPLNGQQADLPTKTITIRESADRILAKGKQDGESFSAVSERQFARWIETGADLLALSR